MVPDEKTAVQFLRGKGLLNSEWLCPSCGHAMRLGRRGLAWRCRKRSCSKELPVCMGTWFDGKCTKCSGRFERYILQCVLYSPPRKGKVLEGGPDNVPPESRAHHTQGSVARPQCVGAGTCGNLQQTRWLKHRCNWEDRR
ncbi:hypothetical protein TTRE_0000856201 [Trichuris trichiura]|uniref:Uncharacterized protein n=1 Tax=Trichuris trichiura TaxID=36087 RepID=A0A077ZKJ7_TRITR|nr:hypothetical protein TTRE_0000856201 [Trichuris trichiura]